MTNMPEQGRTEKEAALKAEIERRLPNFAKVCRDQVGLMIIHQDSFAADYQEDEYRLLGMAIKFAGLHGKQVRIIGKSRETLQGSKNLELVQ